MNAAAWSIVLLTKNDDLTDPTLLIKSQSSSSLIFALFVLLNISTSSFSVILLESFFNKLLDTRLGNP